MADTQQSGHEHAADAIHAIPVPPPRASAGEPYHQERGAAELVPRVRLSGPTPWVVAIMVALTVIAAAAGLALSHITAAARSELSGGLTVQILNANPAMRSREVQASIAALKLEKSISNVHLVPDSEVNRLLSPWLGDAASGPDGGADADDAIPVPALIDAHLDGAITPARLADLRRNLNHVAPSARIDAQAGWLRPVFEVMTSLEWLALAMILLLAVAMAAAVLLAARTALGQHRATIEIVHLLGGTDNQIARIFQRTIGIDAAVGGTVGFAVATLVIWVLGRRFADLDAALVEGGRLGLADWLMLMLIPVAGAGLAVMTARLSVIAALRKSL